LIRLDVSVESNADIKPPMIDVRPLQHAIFVEWSRADRVRGALTRLAITGITMIITGTGTSRCCTRLHRQRHRLQRR
jgi:hypothetical protein